MDNKIELQYSEDLKERIKQEKEKASTKSKETSVSVILFSKIIGD